MSGEVIEFPVKPQPRVSKGLVEVVVREQARQALETDPELPQWMLGELERPAGLGHLPDAPRLPDLILCGTQKKSGTYLLLWHDRAKGTFHLTRFVEGHEQYGYRFSTFA